MLRQRIEIKGGHCGLQRERRHS